MMQNIAKKPLFFQSPDLFRGKSYRIREAYRNAEEEEQNPNLKRYWFEVNGEKEFSSEQYVSVLIALKKMIKGIDKLQFTTHSRYPYIDITFYFTIKTVSQQSN